ncbi:hypothetical protein WMF30_11690 [Sorangium sp. So ce134]
MIAMLRGTSACAWAAVALIGVAASAVAGCAQIIGAEWERYTEADPSGGRDGTCDDSTKNGGETDVDCGGDCLPCKLGKLCTTGADCYTGNCADGLCCNQACDSDCDACTAALKESGEADGTCGPSKANSSCGEPTCTDGVAKIAGTCDGTSVLCAPGEPTSCETFSCDPDANACFTECADDRHCARCHLCHRETGTCAPAPPGTPGLGCGEDQACDAAGACKAANGQICTAAEGCGSGRCVDGVCCDTACDAACKACNLEGWVGICADVPPGAEDGSDCAGATVCDGEGECKLAPREDCTIDEECASGNCLNSPGSVFVCDDFEMP